MKKRMKKRRIYYFCDELGNVLFEGRSLYEVRSELNWAFFHRFHEKFLPKLRYRYC